VGRAKLRKGREFRGRGVEGDGKLDRGSELFFQWEGCLNKREKKGLWIGRE